MQVSCIARGTNKVHKGGFYGVHAEVEALESVCCLEWWAVKQSQAELFGFVGSGAVHVELRRVSRPAALHRGELPACVLPTLGHPCSPPNALLTGDYIQKPGLSAPSLLAECCPAHPC